MREIDLHTELKENVKRKKNWVINKSHVEPIYAFNEASPQISLLLGWFDTAFFFVRLEIAIFCLCSGSVTYRINFWKHWNCTFPFAHHTYRTNPLAGWSNSNWIASPLHSEGHMRLGIFLLATIPFRNFNGEFRRNKETRWATKIIKANPLHMNDNSKKNTMLKQMICASVSNVIVWKWVER